MTSLFAVTLFCESVAVFLEFCSLSLFQFTVTCNVLTYCGIANHVITVSTCGCIFFAL